MNKAYYHVYSFGEDTPKLLTTEREFVIAVNILAYCATIFNCKIIAFVFMNSHFHLVLYGTYEECHAFGTKLMRMILHRINKRLSKPYDPQEVSISTDLIEDKESLMSIITYDLRNPIEAGFKMDPRFYKWSSASLYFAPVVEGNNLIAALSRRSRVATLGVHYDYPEDWTYRVDGAIEARHFVDYKAAEAIFGGIKTYIAFMYLKKDRIFELNTICTKINYQAMSDMELAEYADTKSKSRHGVSFRNLDNMSKISMAQRIKKEKGVGVKQLARVLELDFKILDSLLA